MGGTAGRPAPALTSISPPSQNTSTTALGHAPLCALSGCVQVVGQPYRHKTVYESIYGRKPPYAEELNQMNVTQGK